MKTLTTLFSSTLAVDCHIIKGRLETEGIRCFLYDEEIVGIRPFLAVAVGGVKLKVPSGQVDQARKILDLIRQGKLIDENGEYPVSTIFDPEMKRQNEILSLKNKIRSDSSLLDHPPVTNSEWIGPEELSALIEDEKAFENLSRKEFRFSWGGFFNALFEAEGSIIRYFRTRPVDYYLEKELVELYTHPQEHEHSILCPQCHSDNIFFGYAIDRKWDVLYLLLSLLVWTPFFPIRKKYHCFDCGHDFKKRETLNG